ncbi:MAG TPA: ABC transporter ATP-binding protein [Stellaceae bacterium]|nr:ABC transporter ATP-binding protein [Stellaceae bacterium]
MRAIIGPVPTVLSLQRLSKSFGALKVIDDLSLEVAEGEALGIIGPNGAGKTTLFNLVAGELRPDAGTIHFAGSDITSLSMHARCRRGIGRTYQIPHPFSGMTVFENLLVAAAFGTGRAESACYASCVDILERTGLAGKANRPSGSLTLLERKRLELARALAVEPKLLLLDEIAGGLTESECTSLIETIRDLHRSGVSIVWIEHVVHALLAAVERLVVLNFGQRIAEGDPAEVIRGRAVQEVYMGLEQE